MKLVIIDYGAGNIQSIRFAFQRLGLETILSSDASTIQGADKVIFPGVGEASSAMAKLKHSRLDSVIPTLKQPVLGICLGMQLMCVSSEEGKTKGLGIFNTKVKRFSDTVKVPQIGWNKIEHLKSPLFKNLEDDYIYMVHSFYAPVCDESIATCTYGIEYSAALHKGNFFGTQFHPEKSGNYGAKILQNFVEL
jgi:glutamine amidotransferase